MAVGLPFMIVYGLLYPRAADISALHLKPGEAAFLIGESWGGTECVASVPCVAHGAQRIYIVSPRVFSDAAISVVDEQAGGMTVTQDKTGLLIFVSIWVICVYGTWYFWLRRFLRLPRHQPDSTPGFS